MWTILALSSLGEREAEAEADRKRARSWLAEAQPGESTEWLVVRLLVARDEGDAAAARRLLQQLLERQEPDGGWPWRPGQASDAFSTGQALYALGILHDASAREAAERAVAHLLAAQRDDGTWFVSSTLTSSEPSEAKDSIYTYWGTAWASIGLSRALRESSGGGAQPER
jgi:prenyltransferase beta subunit